MSLRVDVSDSSASAMSNRIQHFETNVVRSGMKRLVLVTCLLIAACASNDYDDYDQPRRGMTSNAGDTTGGAQMIGGLMLPPSDWWRQAEIADLVKPSADQVLALDKLQTGQGNEIEKLQRDMSVAERDLRNVLELDKPAGDAIVSAGQRIKTMRDDIFDRQLQLLAAERTILSREQWSALEDAIRSRRRDRGREGMGGRGRGAYPGRGGRRPGGFPGW